MGNEKNIECTRQKNHNTLCVGHHYRQASTNKKKKKRHELSYKQLGV